MDISSISAALSGLKSAIDLTTLAVRNRDDAKLAEAEKLSSSEILKVNMAALQVQEKNAAMVQEKQALEQKVRELESEIAELRKRRLDRDRYELHEVTQGAFVLAYKKEDGDATPMHYLCQPCMDNKSQKAVLQRHRGRWHATLDCPACKNEYRTGEAVMPSL